MGTEQDVEERAQDLTRLEARARAELLSVARYDVELDLTTGSETFRSTTVVRFSCTRPGESTFIELAADAVTELRLNGVALDPAQYRDRDRLTIPDLASDNELRIVADCIYSRTGEGLHRFVDPADDAVYLYTQHEAYDAHRTFACFDQPDLKAVFALTVRAPQEWHVISNAPADHSGDGTWGFAPTPRISTYLMAVVAGPYHEVRDVHGDLELGLYCRQALAEHLDADELFELTRQGLDFYERIFGMPYPFAKYDQLFVPEFNAGAMENPGCVTYRDVYVFRSKVTQVAYERRAETLLHEMAHMWFGDLVTMAWWDDLWLNESFASYISVVAQVASTRYREGWTTFCAQDKAWAYRQDQLPTTHPIVADAPDVATAQGNFDGITYAKGASVLKQLVAWVGWDEFLVGLRRYIETHAWSNTTLSDLLEPLAEASGRDLEAFSRAWLETTGVPTLRPTLAVDEHGAFTSFAIEQEPPAGGEPRPQRLAIGLYDLEGDALVRRERLELDVVGLHTPVPQLHGVRQPDLVILNDDDLTYAKVRLDERSAATLIDHVAALPNSLARALCWAAAWDMTRDGELATSLFVQQVLHGLAGEGEIGMISSLLGKAFTAIVSYADPAHVQGLLERVATTALSRAQGAAAGSDAQLTYTRTFASAARSDAHLEVLEGLLNGSGAIEGLEVDAELRWDFVVALSAQGRMSLADIAEESRRDPTAEGNKHAATARAARPDAAAKADAWETVVVRGDASNDVLVATAAGIWQPGQESLLASYRERYFADVRLLWQGRSTEMARSLTQILYPSLLVDEETLAATDAVLADEAIPSSLRRLLLEGRDSIERALRARACDRGLQA